MVVVAVRSEPRDVCSSGTIWTVAAIVGGPDQASRCLLGLCAWGSGSHGRKA